MKIRIALCALAVAGATGSADAGILGRGDGLPKPRSPMQNVGRHGHRTSMGHAEKYMNRSWGSIEKQTLKPVPARFNRVR